MCLSRARRGEGGVRGMDGAECVETDVRNSNILPISVVRAAAAFEGRFGQMDIPMQLSVSTSIIARLMGVITKTDTESVWPGNSRGDCGREKCFYDCVYQIVFPFLLLSYQLSSH